MTPDLSRTVLFLLTLVLASAFGASTGTPLRAAEPELPDFWDTRERFPEVDLSRLQRVRFLTTTDFPPFNYLDDAGRLSGFHVDLARSICAELELGERCQIQALPWGELEKAMANGEGEAIMAGLAVTAASRERYVFTRPYMMFPARFATTRAVPAAEPLATSLAGKRIGVSSGTAHERLLRDYFPELRPVTYARQDWMLNDLRDNKIDAVFGDGMRLAFWLAGPDSAGCCQFAGGPYLAPERLGYGLSVAVRPQDADLAAGIDGALHDLAARGTLGELYLRYFPISFY